VTGKEADNLVSVFILAGKLSEPKCSEVRKLCNEYAGQVIGTEWHLMTDGTHCPVAHEKAVELMKTLLDYQPQTENERLLYPQMVQEGTEFWQNRQARVSMAEKGVPEVEWIVLIIGAFTTVFFTYLFGLDDLRLQLLMVAMIGMLISLNLMLLLFFAYPFRGDLSVKTDAFKTVQSIFKGIDAKIN
jgi:hypothetical protein